MRWVGGSGSQLSEEQDSGAIKMAMGAAASGGQSVMGAASKSGQQANAQKQEEKDDKRHNELMGGLSQANSPTPPAGEGRQTNGGDA